jgi:WhiB family redox-sensing transcriptional regulator
LFFPEPGQRAVRALAVCASCSVKTECLAFALINSPHGVWGGMSEKQRSTYKQELRNAQKQAYEAKGP